MLKNAPFSRKFAKIPGFFEFFRLVPINRRSYLEIAAIPMTGFTQIPHEDVVTTFFCQKNARGSAEDDSKGATKKVEKGTKG